MVLILRRNLVGSRLGRSKVLAAPDGETLGCHIVGPQAETLLHEVVYSAFDERSDATYSTAPDWRNVSDG